MNSSKFPVPNRRMPVVLVHIGRICRRLWRCALPGAGFCGLMCGLVSYGQQSGPVMPMTPMMRSGESQLRASIQAPEPPIRQPVAVARINQANNATTRQADHMVPGSPQTFASKARTQNQRSMPAAVQQGEPANSVFRGQGPSVGAVYATWQRNLTATEPTTSATTTPLPPHGGVRQAAAAQPAMRMLPQMQAPLQTGRQPALTAPRPTGPPWNYTMPESARATMATSPMRPVPPQTSTPQRSTSQTSDDRTPPVHVYPDSVDLSDVSQPPATVALPPEIHSPGPTAAPPELPRPQNHSRFQNSPTPEHPGTAQNSTTMVPQARADAAFPVPSAPRVHVYPDGVTLHEPQTPAQTGHGSAEKNANGQPIFVYPGHRVHRDKANDNNTNRATDDAPAIHADAPTTLLKLPARPISYAQSMASGHALDFLPHSSSAPAQDPSSSRPAYQPPRVLAPLRLSASAQQPGPGKSRNGHWPPGNETEVAPQKTMPELPWPGKPLPMDSPEVGQTDPESEIFWWEADLPKTILRGRQTYAITLQQALGLALTQAPELQVLHSDWFMQQLEITRRDAAFDWTTFADSVWNRDSVPVGSNLDGATNRLRSRALNAGAGLRRLGRDGSELELSQRLGTRGSNSVFINPNNQGTTRLGFTYEKPLLRGGGKDYNSGRVRLAAVDNDAAFDRFQAGIQDHLLAVSSAYWSLVMQRGQFLLAVNSWNRARQIADEMASRVEIDVTPNMLDRARSEVAGRLATAIEAEHDTIQTQDELLRLIFGAHYTDFADREIVTLTLPMTKAEAVTPEAHIETALHSRSEIHEAIRDIKAASIQYDLAANEVLPMLDLVLTGYVAGLARNNNVGQSFVNQFNQGEPGVGVGLNFEVPYRNRAAQATAEQGFIAIKRMQAQLESTIGEVTEDVREQVIERNKYGAVLKQQWESLARAKRILKYTETRREVLADGADVADLYLENLLQMQTRLAVAERNYLESQVRFSLADNALLRAVSQLDTLADRGP